MFLLYVMANSLFLFVRQRLVNVLFLQFAELAEVVLVNLDMDVVVILFGLFDIFDIYVRDVMLLEIDSYYFLRESLFNCFDFWRTV